MPSSYDLFGGGVSDIFGGVAQGMKSDASKLEAGQYREAAKFSRFNEDVTKQSTEIKLAQQQRQAYQGIGAVEAGVAAGGFSMSGSGLDILRSSTQQAALEHAVVGQQGQVAALGYEEQAKSYDAMAVAADKAAEAGKMGSIGSYVTGAIKIGAAAYTGGASLAVTGV